LIHPLLIDPPMIENLPCHNPPRLVHNAQDRAPGDAFAAAALPNDAQRVSPPNFKADTIHRPHCPFVEEEVCFQVLDFEQWRTVGSHNHYSCLK
jgi:hypothetical protein